MRLLRAFMVCWGFSSVWSFCGLAGACGAFYGAFMAFRLLGYCSQISQHWRGSDRSGLGAVRGSDRREGFTDRGINPARGLYSLKR